MLCDSESFLHRCNNRLLFLHILVLTGLFGCSLCFILGLQLLLLALILAFIINGRFGFVPLLFVRIINDKSFLAEYERRLDRVVEHDLKKKYHIGRKLGEGVTSAVYRIQERTSGTFFALKKIPLKGSSSLQRAVERVVGVGSDRAGLGTRGGGGAVASVGGARRRPRLGLESGGGSDERVAGDRGAR